MTLSVATALQALEHLGSDEDPIEHRGEETTARDAADAYSDFFPASKVLVSYYGGPGTGRWIKRGTLQGMVRDRRRLQTERGNEPTCPTCERAWP